jgi:hypothetical protein
MTPSSSAAAVRFSELLDAFEFVSFGGDMDHSAFIDPDTGSIYYVSSETEMDDEVPEELESSDRYIAVPHKGDFNLGRDLALSFADEQLPSDYETITGFFRKKGAYARFKDFLDARNLLQLWYDFEARAKQKALRAWCQANDIAIIDEPPPA